MVVADQDIWTILEDVADPEIPVLSVLDLGIVRAVRREGDAVEVTITPTYSGCPATAVIGRDIERALHAKGFANVRIRSQLEPAWTTDWLTDSGREKLHAYGIAPPRARDASTPVACPRCMSLETEMTSRFGSTPCKALYRCTRCLEPFDYFKCH